MVIKTYGGCFFLFTPDLVDWSVLVLDLEPPWLPGPPPKLPPPAPDAPEFGPGLFAGMFMFLTDSRIICRIVFKNAFRNSEVL